ncbi:MAG: Fimbrial assembly protein (PilN) [Firmicutes bacterium ADurb.Bin506]|jgi:Tfp pilus assembly protein PilN|nr:MAG: Fimbrial assembly protein (PilN) [Firmicutes bacterium ADurb.Bin506]
MTKINLLPQQRAPKRQKRLGPIVWIVLLEVVLLAASTVYSARHFSIVSMRDEAAQLREQVAAFKTDLEMIDAVQARTKAAQSVIDEIQGLAALGHRPVPVLREIKAITPGDVWVTSFNVKPDGAVSIGGGAFSMESVARMARQLVHSWAFDSVEVGDVNLVPAGDPQHYTFTMTCSVQAGR